MGIRVYLKLPSETSEAFTPQSRRSWVDHYAGCEPRLWYLLFAHPETVRFLDEAAPKLELTGRLLFERLLAFRWTMRSLFSSSVSDPRSRDCLGNRIPVGSHGWNQIRAIATKYPVRDVLGLLWFLSSKYDDLQPITLDLRDEALNRYEGRLPQFLQHLDERLQRGAEVFQSLTELQFTDLNVPESLNGEDATPTSPIDAEILTWIVTTNGEREFYRAMDYYFPDGLEVGNVSLSQ